jgi:hypothetical protein
VALVVTVFAMVFGEFLPTAGLQELCRQGGVARCVPDPAIVASYPYRHRLYTAAGIARRAAGWLIIMPYRNIKSVAINGLIFYCFVTHIYLKLF